MRARLLVVVLAIATALLGGCGGDSGSGSDGTAAARRVLKDAAQHPAKSADVRASFVVRLNGVPQLSGPVTASFQGPLRSNGRGKLPDLDWRVRASATGRNVALRVITLSDDAFVEYGGTTYEVGKRLVARLLAKSRSRQQQKDVRRLGIDGSNWLKNGKVSGGGRTVSGDLDVPAALRDVNRVLAKVPKGHPIPQRDIRQIDKAVTKATLHTTIGADHILRQSRFDFAFRVPSNQQSQAHGLKSGSVKFQLDQSNVNGNQHVTAPSGTRPLEELLRRFGVPSQALMGPGLTPGSSG